MAKIRWDQFFDTELIVFSVFAFFYLYCLIMLVTSKQKLIRGSFFMIYVFTGFSDVVHFLSHQYCLTSFRLGLGPSFNWLLIIAANMISIVFCIHVLGNFLMTLSQYMAVCHPHSFSRAWSCQRTLVYLLLLTILTTGITFEGWFMVCEYVRQEDDSYEVAIVSSTPSVNTSASICVIFYVFVSSFLVVKTIVRLRKFEHPSKTMKKHYKNLAIMTLADVIMFSVDLVYEFSYIFGTSWYPKFLLDFLNNEFELYYPWLYSGNVVTLVIFSGIARRELFRIFSQRLTTVSEVVSSKSRQKIVVVSPMSPGT